MDIKILCGIKGLLFATNDDYKAGTFTLSNKYDLLKQSFHTKPFLEKVGLANATLPFQENVFSVCIVNVPKKFSDLSQLEISKDLTEQTYYIAQNLRDFLKFLWFIKDNCIAMDLSIGHISEGDNPALVITSKIAVSNLYGEFANTYFTKKEMDEAVLILKKFREICPGKEVKIDSRVYHQGEDIQPKLVVVKGQHKDHKYNDSNRIQRAMDFLAHARQTHSLPHKIALYMPIFECLFSKDASEVTQKVSERVAYFIGSSRENRIGIFRTMREAYDVRSKFLHGQELKSKHNNVDNQKLLALKIDHITRLVLTKVILTHSSSFIDDKANRDWDTDFENYLNELIF